MYDTKYFIFSDDTWHWHVICISDFIHTTLCKICILPAKSGILKGSSVVEVLFGWELAAEDEEKILTSQSGWSDGIIIFDDFVVGGMVVVLGDSGRHSAFTSLLIQLFLSVLQKTAKFKNE